MMAGTAIVVSFTTIETLPQFGAVKDGMPLELLHFFHRMIAAADLIGSHSHIKAKTTTPITLPQWGVQ
jgi:hypothetical protein